MSKQNVRIPYTLDVIPESATPVANQEALRVIYRLTSRVELRMSRLRSRLNAKRLARN